MAARLPVPPRWAQPRAELCRSVHCKTKARALHTGEEMSVERGCGRLAESTAANSVPAQLRRSDNCRQPPTAGCSWHSGRGRVNAPHATWAPESVPPRPCLSPCDTPGSHRGTWVPAPPRAQGGSLPCWLGQWGDIAASLGALGWERPLPGPCGTLSAQRPQQLGQANLLLGRWVTAAWPWASQSTSLCSETTIGCTSHAHLHGAQPRAWLGTKHQLSPSCHHHPLPSRAWEVGWCVCVSGGGMLYY